jgi:transposase-like protein
MTVVAWPNGSGHLLDETFEAHNTYTRPAVLDDCWHCKSPREHNPNANRGLCARCYRRWQCHGFAGDAPPDAVGNRGEYVIGERIGWQRVALDAGVLADFARLDRPEIPGRTAELCRRFGVSRRTLSRWRARLKQQQRHAELLATAARACGRSRWRSRLRPGATYGRGSPDEAGPVAAMVAAQILDQTASSVARAAYFRA